MRPGSWKAVGACAVLIAFACLPVLAQAPAGPFKGTITLRNGTTISGEIKLADFSVIYGSGIGSLHTEDYGALRLKVGDEEVTIPGRDIWTVDVQWNNEGTDAEPKWVITNITVMRKDGTKVSGQATWLLHSTTVHVVLDNGQVKRVHAFPLAQKDFSPDNFIARIVIGEEPPTAPAPAEAPTAPAEAPTAPAPAETPTAPAEAPTAPAPAETPTAPAEAPTAPAPAETPTAPAEGPTAPAPAETPTAPAEIPTAPAPAETPAAPAQPALPPVAAKCILTFNNLKDAAEVERVKAIIATYAVEGKVDVGADQSGAVTMGFVLPDVGALSKLVEDFKYKKTAAGKTLVFQETERGVSASFRTVEIRGSLKVSVSFNITPGATLYHSPAPGEEIAVPADRIDKDGNVTLDVSIPRGASFVYARSVLGEVERCVKIDIYSGELFEISKEEYQAHK